MPEDVYAIGAALLRRAVGESLEKGLDLYAFGARLDEAMRTPGAAQAFGIEACRAFFVALSAYVAAAHPSEDEYQPGRMSEAWERLVLPVLDSIPMPSADIEPGLPGERDRLYVWNSPPSEPTPQEDTE